MKAVFPPCLIQTGRKLTFIWNFVAFGFREGPAWNLHVLHPCACQRLPSLRSPAPQSPRTWPREGRGGAGKVLELFIPGEAPESVAHPGRGPRICASSINIIQRHSGLTGSQLKLMSLCDRIAPKRIGSHADRTRIARGSHQTGSLKSRCLHSRGRW